jgi:hypothetical protein
VSDLLLLGLPRASTWRTVSIPVHSMIASELRRRTHSTFTEKERRISRSMSIDANLTT